MKLKHKITFTIISSGLVLSLFLISIFTIWSKFEIEHKTADSMNFKNTLINYQIDNYFNNRFYEIKNLSQKISNLDPKKSKKQIEAEFYNFRNELKQYQNISYYNLAGKKLIDTNQIDVGSTIDLKEYLIPHDLNNSTLTYRNDPSLNLKVITLIQLVEDKNKNKVGYLMANILQNSISNIIRSIITKKYQNGVVEIFREDGHILYSNQNQNQIEVSVNQLNNYKNILKQTDANFKFQEDENSFYSISKSNTNQLGFDHSWYLIVKEFKNELYEEVNQRVIILAFATLFLITTFSLITYFFVTTITKPIEDATYAISEFGNGNFVAIQSLKPTDDEFGQLIFKMQDSGNKIEKLITDKAIEYRMNAMGKMAGSIAHEINNPLHLINNHALLLNKLLIKNQYQLTFSADQEKANKNLKSIISTVNRISNIILGMKTISRDSSNDPICEITCNELLENVLQLCRENIVNFGVELVVENNCKDTIIECRPAQLQQAILNVIQNAIDVTKNFENKKIEIKVNLINSKVKMEIINSGPKISTEITQFIFNPFFTTQLDGQKIGLGLSIAKGITHSHHGSLEVDLSNPHTSFVFNFPIKQKLSKSEDLKAA
jgi:signal transduction histidine kinase